MSNLKLQECHIKSIHEICDSYKNDPGDLIKILHSAQTHFGYLPESVQREIAKKLKISVAKVYGVVTFYSFFTMTPKGRHAISVCMGTACYVRGAGLVLDELEKQLGIRVGETTEDGLFTLDACRCLGACGLAPVLTVDAHVHGRLSKDNVTDIIKKYKEEQ